MTVIEAEAEKAEASSDEEQEDDEDSDEMRDRSVIDSDEYEPRPDTIASQPSVVTIDSRDTSTESSSTVRASTTVSSIRAVSENDY
jgi:DNA mismatch repair protein MSH4